MVWNGKEMTPSKKKLSYLYWVIEESKDELQKMLDKPGNSHAVSSRNDFIAGLDWTYNEVAGKQAQVQEAIASFCGLGN